MELLRLIGENASLWVSLLALVIAFYAAVHARRSAQAAEQSARSAEEAVVLEREEIRETWIRRLDAALPDGDRVTSLIADMPSSLRPEWLQLVTSAARRNPRTPERYFQGEMLPKYEQAWEAAASSTIRPAEGNQR